LVAVFEGLGEGQCVERLLRRHETTHGAKDDAVIADEKIRFRNHRRNVMVGIVGEHQPADHRLLCLQ